MTLNTTYPAIMDPDLETLDSRELFNCIEKARLEKQLIHVAHKSQFYQDKFYKLGIDITDPHMRFVEIPFTEKAEILEDQTQVPPFGSNLCVDMKDVQRVHKTSGTTNRALILALTQHDIDATIDSGARCFWASGLRPGNIVVHCLNYCLWMGGFTDHQSLERTGAVVIPFGIGNSKSLIELILTLKVDAIHCTPSYISKLEVLLKNEFNMDPRDLGLRLGLFAGEAGIQNTELRKRIERLWGMKAMDANYGMADVLSMFGAECNQRNGLHFMGQGNVLVELIDPETLKCIPISCGTIGELVLTNLNKQAQPLIRYRTHDLLEIVDHEQCGCGRKSFRFKVIGRTDDMIVVKGVNIFPNSVRDILSQFVRDLTGEFQIVIHTPPPLTELHIKVECKKHLSKDEREKVQRLLERKFKEKLTIRPKLEMVSEGSLPRTEGKSKRIVNLFKHK